MIYTSIAILHWWFCATAKYPDGIARGGAMMSETHRNATRPFTGCGFVCFAVETICDRYAETTRSVDHCTMVFQKILQRKRGDTRDAGYTAGPTSVCFFIVRICLTVCLVVTHGYSGSDRSPIYSLSIYPSYGWCAADQCTWTCVDRQLCDNSGSSKVIAYCCCSLRTRDIFANGVDALRMPAILNPYPDE